MYEYRVEVCENCIDPPLEPDAIQRWAKKGWRLVATVVDTEGRQRYYWERKIPGTTGLDITPRCPPRR